MSIRFVGITLLIALTLFCTGCYGSKETDDVAYVLVLGLDKAENNKRRATYQIAVRREPGNNNENANGSGTDKKDGNQKVPWITNTILMSSPSEARMLLNASMSRYPKLNHITVIIFSEELAREGIDKIISYQIRNRDFRETLFLIVVQGTAEEYIKRNNPTLDIIVSRFYETALVSASETGYYLSTNTHEFYNRLKNSGGSPYVAFSGINPKNGEDKPAGVKTPEQKGDAYLPGGVPRTGTENPAEFFGLAVFRGDKMVGVLNSDETRAVAILQGRFPHGYVGVVDPLHPEKEAVNLNVRCDGKPKIIVDLNDSLPVFNIQVQIEGELLGITSETNYEAAGYRELLEAQIAAMFKSQLTAMLKHTQELGVDPVGLGLYLRPKFPSTSEMEQTNLTDLYKTANIHVNVTAKIRRTGLIWRNSPANDY